MRVCRDGVPCLMGQLLMVRLALSLCVHAGADALIKLLKNYCRNKDLKTSIHVGVIGFPNVGKSSLINSLKRSKVCGVGATPGFTKTAQVRADTTIHTNARTPSDTYTHTYVDRHGH